jgi:hypothetical protein
MYAGITFIMYAGITFIMYAGITFIMYAHSQMIGKQFKSLCDK